ncbi:MAG: ATP-dependent metallopeptidase FtsH/Yme1/Tma family protein, partial [Syntrophales bacterium]|nr:ATP-dependent metallopeptidase FtsH/Yme1/Tma family protein [Syntrophales bacterium]
MQKHYKFSIWYVLLGIWVVLLVQNYIASMFAAQVIPYSQFLSLLKAGKVTEIAVTANQIQGKMKVDGEAGDFRLFKTIRVDPDLSAMLEQYPVSFKGEIESTFLRDLFSWIFPLLLFVGVWYFLMKRMGGQQAGFMTLGKNKAKIYMENELNVTFA